MFDADKARLTNDMHNSRFCCKFYDISYRSLISFVSCVYLLHFKIITFVWPAVSIGCCGRLLQTITVTALLIFVLTLTNQCSQNCYRVKKSNFRRGHEVAACFPLIAMAACAPSTFGCHSSMVNSRAGKFQ